MGASCRHKLSPNIIIVNRHDSISHKHLQTQNNYIKYICIPIFKYKNNVEDNQEEL